MTGGSYDMCHKCIISHCTVFYWMPQHHCIMMTSWNGNIFRVTGPCAGNSPVTGEFPSQVPVMRSFDVFLGPHLSGRMNTHPGRQWFQTASRPLWRHCSDDEAFHSAGAVCGKSSPKVSQGVPHGLPIRVNEVCGAFCEILWWTKF